MDAAVYAEQSTQHHRAALQRLTAALKRRCSDIERIMASHQWDQPFPFSFDPATARETGLDDGGNQRTLHTYGTLLQPEQSVGDEDGQAGPSRDYSYSHRRLSFQASPDQSPYPAMDGGAEHDFLYQQSLNPHNNGGSSLAPAFSANINTNMGVTTPISVAPGSTTSGALSGSNSSFQLRSPAHSYIHQSRQAVGIATKSTGSSRGEYKWGSSSYPIWPATLPPGQTHTSQAYIDAEMYGLPQAAYDGQIDDAGLDIGEQHGEGNPYLYDPLANPTQAIIPPFQQPTVPYAPIYQPRPASMYPNTRPFGIDPRVGLPDAAGPSQTIHPGILLPSASPEKMDEDTDLNSGMVGLEPSSDNVMRRHKSRRRTKSVSQSQSHARSTSIQDVDFDHGARHSHDTRRGNREPRNLSIGADDGIASPPSLARPRGGMSGDMEHRYDPSAMADEAELAELSMLERGGKEMRKDKRRLQNRLAQRAFRARARAIRSSGHEGSTTTTAM